MARLNRNRKNNKLKIKSKIRLTDKLLLLNIIAILSLHFSYHEIINYILFVLKLLGV